MTKENFEGWLTYEITEEVKKFGERRVREWQDMLIELAGGCNDTDRLALQSARLAGMIAGINAILELTWEDFTND